MTEITPKELMETLVSVADCKKARDIVVMQVTGQPTLTD